MTAVEIEYCVPCGMLERALSVQEAIARQFGDQLDRISLVMGDHVIFVVRVDDEMVFDISEDAYDIDDIVRRLRPHVQ